MDSLTKTTVYAVIALLVFWGWRRARSKQQRYPPGPPPALLAGNLKDIPRGGNEWVAHMALGKQYGEFSVYSPFFICQYTLKATLCTSRPFAPIWSF